MKEEKNYPSVGDWLADQGVCPTKQEELLKKIFEDCGQKIEIDHQANLSIQKILQKYL